MPSFFFFFSVFSFAPFLFFFFFFHLVSTPAGHTPKREREEREGEEGGVVILKIRRIYLAVAGAGPVQSSVRPSGRSREKAEASEKIIIIN